MKNKKKRDRINIVIKQLIIDNSTLQKQEWYWVAIKSLSLFRNVNANTAFDSLVDEYKKN